ncbi:MAG: thiamine phosphate synthase [Actinobacteria bacterium 13_1_20CM_3_71_11]|nr:MAG: thiamine phosphate synthase [Actinobacteria bacterium 13_1_20CM_3_71_11]
MRLLVLTDRAQARRPLPEVLAAAVDGGARWIVLREKDLPRADRFALAEEIRALLGPVGGTLIVAGPDPLGGDAVHLSATGPVPPGVSLVGRSCHTAADVDRLSTEDYATVSPVYPSASKPGYGPALGPAGLGALAARTSKGVYGLGGVESAARARDCLADGAAGVAVMGAVMRAGDPAATVAALLSAVSP